MARRHRRQHHLDLGTLPFSDRFVRMNTVLPVALSEPKTIFNLIVRPFSCLLHVMRRSYHMQRSAYNSFIAIALAAPVH
jgi:hypothetical protein